MKNVTIASSQQALQVQQRNQNTSSDFEVVFQHWLNQHFNTPILILVSIFNFLWKLFTFSSLFGWNIEVRFQLSLSLLETTSIFASLIPSQQILNFQPFQSNSDRQKESNRKSLQNACVPLGSQYAQFVTLCTQELIWGGKHLRGCGNWLWDFLMLFKIEELNHYSRQPRHWKCKSDHRITSGTSAVTPETSPGEFRFCFSFE